MKQSPVNASTLLILPALLALLQRMSPCAAASLGKMWQTWCSKPCEGARCLRTQAAAQAGQDPEFVKLTMQPEQASPVPSYPFLAQRLGKQQSAFSG